MIVQKDFLNKLKDFGLNSYEAKLWTALLSRGTSTAGELSDIANVPRSRCYDVLESLEKKSFIIVKIGKPIKYIAIEPAEVLERVKKQVSLDADAQVKMLDELNSSETLKELDALYNQGIEMVEPSELTGSVKGRTNVYNHMDSMIKNAEKEVVLMTSDKGLSRKHDELKRSLKKAKERGVDIKFITPSSADKSVVANMAAYGDVRHSDDVKGRFMLVDGQQVTFMLTDDEEVHPSYDTAVWARTPFFADTVKGMFNKIWNN